MKKAAKRGKKAAKTGKKTAKAEKKAAKSGQKSASRGRGVWYAYGIVRSDFSVGRAPAGLDDAAVEVAGVQSGRIAALVSRLSAEAYDATVVEDNSGDVS